MNILTVKIFGEDRWNYSSLKYMQNSVVNIPTLGIKTGPLESFRIRGSQDPSTIPRQARSSLGAMTIILGKTKKSLIKQKGALLAYTTRKARGGTKLGIAGSRGLNNVRVLSSRSNLRRPTGPPSIMYPLLDH